MGVACYTKASHITHQIWVLSPLKPSNSLCHTSHSKTFGTKTCLDSKHNFRFLPSCSKDIWTPTTTFSIRTLYAAHLLSRRLPHQVLHGEAKLRDQRLEEFSAQLWTFMKHHYGQGETLNECMVSRSTSCWLRLQFFHYNDLHGFLMFPHSTTSLSPKNLSQLWSQFSLHLASCKPEHPRGHNNAWPNTAKVHRWSPNKTGSQINDVWWLSVWSVKASNILQPCTSLFKSNLLVG